MLKLNPSVFRPSTTHTNDTNEAGKHVLVKIVYCAIMQSIKAGSLNIIYHEKQ